jgi:hypothetical protein
MRKPGTATPPVLVLTAVSMCGLFVPPTALFLFQPLRWATAIVASAYFWAAASLWGCVMLDFAWSGQTSQETAIEASSMADLNEAASSHSGTE